jgi:hypothetical protein
MPAVVTDRAFPKLVKGFEALFCEKEDKAISMNTKAESNE